MTYFFINACTNHHKQLDEKWRTLYVQTNVISIGIYIYSIATISFSCMCVYNVKKN